MNWRQGGEARHHFQVVLSKARCRRAAFTRPPWCLMGGAKAAIGPVTALLSPQREQIGDSRRVRRVAAAPLPNFRFAPDSPLEGDGFEPSRSPAIG
jgi:hypothetical protein